MLALDTVEGKNLQFEVQIQGIQPDQLKGVLRFDIDGVEYGFPAKISEGSISVDLPPMSNIIQKRLKDGAIIEGRLEVTGNGIFTEAWNGEFEVKSPLQIKAKLVQGKSEVTEHKENSSVTKDTKEGEIIKVTSVVSEKKESGEEQSTNRVVQKLKDKGVVPDKEEDRKKLVEKKVQEKINSMGSLVDSLLDGKRIQKSTPKKVVESKRPARRKVQEVSVADSKDDVFNYMISRGLRNSRVQEHILEKAEMMVGTDGTFTEILDQVKMLLSNQPNSLNTIGEMKNVKPDTH